MSEMNLNLGEFLPYRLAVASTIISDKIGEEYRRKFSLRIPEWRIIAILGQGKPMTQRDLVTTTQLDKVTINRAAKVLVDRGYASRLAHEADGRSHHLELTDAGRELYQKIIPVALAKEAEITSRLSSKDRQTLLEILEKLTGPASHRLAA